MNKESIGTNAGIIWRIMNNHMSWNYAELKEKSRLSDMDLCMAIGWLARENKIEFGNESKDLRIYLNFNPYF